MGQLLCLGELYGSGRDCVLSEINGEEEATVWAGMGLR
jgi:hypothetical protein